MMLAITSITKVNIYLSPISRPLLYLVLMRMNKILYPLKVFGRFGILRDWSVDYPYIITPALPRFRWHGVTTLMTFCPITQDYFNFVMEMRCPFDSKSRLEPMFIF